MIYAKLIAGVVLAGLLSWGAHSIYASIRDKAHARGMADTQQAERDCIENSVCAEAAINRAAAQQVVVDKAREEARLRAEAAAAEQLAQEVTAREAAESRASAARAAASAAERRYRQALAGNQACAAWAAAPVPCPLTAEE